MATAKCHPTTMAADAALAKLRFPFALWNAGKSVPMSDHPITTGYIYERDLSDFMDANLYKVADPIAKSEWWVATADERAMHSDSGLPPLDPPVAIVIGGKVREDSIHFIVRYKDSDNWVISEDIESVAKRLNVEMPNVGYWPHHITQRSLDNGLFPISHLLSKQITMDARFECPYECDVEHCPCGCLLDYEKDVTWTGCDKCGRWWHTECCTDANTADTYVCDMCKDSKWDSKGPFRCVLPGHLFQTRPKTTAFDVQQCGEADYLDFDEYNSSASVGQKRKVIDADDGNGPFKRGPGRLKSGEFFHSHYGRISSEDFCVV